MDHAFEQHKGCQKTACMICDGGLAYCTVCRTGECEIPTDCPGEPVPLLAREELCAGSLDFFSGVWFKDDRPIKDFNERYRKD